MIHKKLVFARKIDIFILVGLLLLLFLTSWIPSHHAGTIAEIRLQNQVLAELPLAQNRKNFTVIGARGYRFTIEEGLISVTAAPCTAQICVHSPAIGYAGQQIICLPTQLIITIIAPDHYNTPDVVL